MGVPSNHRAFTYFKFVHAKTDRVLNFRRPGDTTRTVMLCEDATQFVQDLRQAPENIMDWDPSLDIIPVSHVGRCTQGVHSRRRQESKEVERLHRGGSIGRAWSEAIRASGAGAEGVTYISLSDQTPLVEQSWTTRVVSSPLIGSD